MTKQIAIDLGTANTVVWLVGKGIVLNEPTVVAISVDDNRVLAIGNEAKQMLGRTPGNIAALKPLRDGVIADYEVTEAMLRYFVQKVCGRIWIFKPEVMICTPAGVTQVERRAVLDATLSAGARVAYLIDEPLAAAIGANIPIANPSGSMVLDMGGGASESAVISLGGVVVHKSVRVAGNKIDESIISYLRRKHNIIIGEQTAEETKIKIGSATPLAKEEVLEIKGRDSLLGLPKIIAVSSTEVTEAIRPTLNMIITMVKEVLEETAPELASDIIDKGIVMTGGTSLLKNYDQLLTQELGVSCHVAEDPLFCVVKGTGIALENIDLYKRSIIRK
ncbi:rod shape-determining protein [Candidatus Shapirobacteria bacterium CG03_land_8_20_14_0_80_39_12]|uniref:Cell shape-determining protein MreB n=1 Tax=Candidatus Shapirobacteria bacterium CG03_land_8_20_14_0_80_39_12 TaxID=1974879 RepID=A0A2M7BB57_9BACT|nr:MAG: rod shape-determining protein [Candidatus Shapirobacteria bacterium CG03_land_8_20_14_0_80_39_12]